MENIKQKKLRTLFISYLARFLIAGLLLLAVLILLYMTALNTGFVRIPAYEENAIAKVSEQIRQGEKVEQQLLPDTCLFGVYDKDGRYLYGSFEKSQRREVWENWKAQTPQTPALYAGYYRAIPKDNGSIALIRYQVIAKFENSLLRKLFPNAELFFTVLFLILFVLLILFTAGRFGKYVQKRLTPVIAIAEKVGNEDLNFGQEHSNIREINDILATLFQMKEALQTSLRRQWDGEKQKQQQVSALAHDIKTPLTIIRGNAELLREAEIPEEARRWSLDILKSTGEIEQYLQVLQSALRPEARQDPAGQSPSSFEAAPFLTEIKEKADALGRKKGLAISCDFPRETIRLYGNRKEISRAISNILSNAAEYSPAKGAIALDARINAPFLKITVTDSGPGFTKEALRHGTEQFFQEDKSRSQKDHYGMGLYIARAALEEHGGFLELSNSRQTGGGQVSAFIPTVPAQNP